MIFIIQEDAEDGLFGVKPGTNRSLGGQTEVDRGQEVFNVQENFT